MEYHLEWSPVPFLAFVSASHLFLSTSIVSAQAWRPPLVPVAVKVLRCVRVRCDAVMCEAAGQGLFFVDCLRCAFFWAFIYWCPETFSSSIVSADWKRCDFLHHDQDPFSTFHILPSLWDWNIHPASFKDLMQLNDSRVFVGKHVLNVSTSCNKDTAFQDRSLLACKLSLDEMGVLFELPSIGSGDKEFCGSLGAGNGRF